MSMPVMMFLPSSAADWASSQAVIARSLTQEA